MDIKNILYLFKEINEGAYQGLLFRAVSASDFFEILKQHKITATKSTVMDVKRISFARSRTFWYGSRSYRLVLDGTRIAQDYKLIPYTSGNNPFDPGKTRFKSAYSKEPGGDFEYELQIHKDLINLERYLLAIEVDRNVNIYDIENIQKLLDTEGYSRVKINQPNLNPKSGAPTQMTIGYHKQTQEYPANVLPYRSPYELRGKRKLQGLGIPQTDVRTAMPSWRQQRKLSLSQKVKDLVSGSILSALPKGYKFSKKQAQIAGIILGNHQSITGVEFKDLLQSYDSTIDDTTSFHLWKYFKDSRIVKDQPNSISNYDIDQYKLDQWFINPPGPDAQRQAQKETQRVNFIFYRGLLKGKVPSTYSVLKKILGGSVSNYLQTYSFTYRTSLKDYVASPGQYHSDKDATEFVLGFPEGNFNRAYDYEHKLITRASDINLQELSRFETHWDSSGIAHVKKSRHLYDRTIDPGDDGEDILQDILHSTYTHDTP